MLQELAERMLLALPAFSKIKRHEEMKMTKGKAYSLSDMHHTPMEQMTHVIFECRKLMIRLD